MGQLDAILNTFSSASVKVCSRRLNFGQQSPLLGDLDETCLRLLLAVVSLNCIDYELFILAADRLNLSVFVELESAQARHLLEDDAVGGLDSVLDAVRSDRGH